VDADRIVGQISTASPACERFIQGWEKCRLTPYQDQAGNWTVGWGHLMQPGDPRVPITQDEADALFDHELLHTADGVGDLIALPLSQQQFDALVAFSYNCGVGAFASSTLRTAVNAADFASAADDFGAWNKVRDPATGLLVVSAGLTKRRAAERAIFVNGDYSGRP
jgi:lysozyme